MFNITTDNNGLWVPSWINDTHIKFDVTIPSNSYLAVGFGKDMYNTDMIIYQALNGNNAALGTWSTGHSCPVTNTI